MSNPKFSTEEFITQNLREVKNHLEKEIQKYQKQLTEIENLIQKLGLPIVETNPLEELSKLVWMVPGQPPKKIKKSKAAKSKKEPPSPNRNKVLNTIFKNYLTVDEIVDVTGLEKTQVKSVLYSNSLQSELRKRNSVNRYTPKGQPYTEYGYFPNK